jgi:menaquinone-dependent protoporphyrinogen IX oxidase
MKRLVIYDSTYGNTRKIAEAIAASIDAISTHIDNIEADQVRAADLIIVGSPTQGGRATVDLQEFLRKLPDDVLTDKPAAAFDTRFAIDEHGPGLKLVMKTVGFAAPKISRELEKRGCQIVSEPEGFIVNDTQGPLQRNELAHASEWAKETVLSASVNT